MPFIKMQKWAFFLLINILTCSAAIQAGNGIYKQDVSERYILEIEYKIWKAESQQKANELKWELFQFYKKERKWDLGFKTLFRLDQKEMNESQRIDYKIQLALVDMLLDFPQKAIEVCLAIENDTLSFNQRKLMTSILLVSLIKTGEYRLSQTKLENYLTQNFAEKSIGFELKEKYRNEVIQISNLPLKSIRKARNLSMFLPSAGIFYAGSPRKGFTNLGIQMAAAGYLTANILTQNYFTAATFNLHLLRLFFIGGVNQTDGLVRRRNQELTEKNKIKLEEIVFEILNL